MRLIRTLRRLIPFHRWLSVVGLAFGGYLLLSVPLVEALTAASEFLKVDLTLTPWGFLLSGLWLIVYVRMLLFSHLATYLLASGFGMALALAALIWGRPWWGTRILLILMVLAILAFPWFQHYRPVVAAAPGYQMRWPTQPARLETVVKSAQAAAEIQPCQYTLLGWSPNGVLYYRERCRWGAQAWAYDPVAEGRPRQVTETPSDLVQETRGAWELDGIQVPGVPPEGQPHTRDVVVQGQGLASPDGRWVAVVVRHLYGPEDVVVLAVEGK